MNLLKKIVAFDLDGTLAESKQQMSEEMADILFSLAKERKVVIISGGSFHQFEKQFLPSFNIKNSDQDLIYSNLYLLPTSGSRRFQYNFENKEWQVTDTEEMPKEVRLKVLVVLKDLILSGKYDMVPIIAGDEIIEDRITQITLSALGQHAPLEDKKIWDPDQLKRQEIKKELELLLPEVDINIGGTTSLDILPKGFNKAKGLIRLIDNLEIEKIDMIFVGDAIFPGGNDYSPYEAGIECLKTSGPAETVKIIKNWLE